MEPELIVLVDEKNQEIGTAPKLESHHANTPLHRGFSCYAFNPDGQFLLTQRALAKKTFPGVWTNSVCGHPGPDEMVEDAVRRRLKFELGLTARQLLLVLPVFRYRAEMNGTVENEICPVLVAVVESEPTLNREEVEAYQWIAWEEFAQELKKEPAKFSYWCRKQVEELETSESFRNFRDSLA